MARQQTLPSCMVQKMVAAFKTGVDFVADAVSVCSDSDYNQTTTSKRRKQSRRQNRA